MATENVSDAHDGIKSVELSNTAGLEWTYFYSDTGNAPLVFIANQSYLVKGWIKIIEQGKRADLSIFWNNSQDFMNLYKDNPDPVSDPDWFMVEATITPVADFSDGYLSLGFRADKDGDLGVGRILFDDFSVTRLPSTETDIIEFSVPEQTGPAIIDALMHTVTVEVPYGIDVTALVPTIQVSPWATINPASGVAVDFTAPYVYTVTAEDEMTSQDWTVTVTFAPPSAETEIVSFTLAEQAAPATIDNLLHTVTIQVPYATDVTSLAPSIGLSTGATIVPASGVAADFSSPVVYTVTAQDGITTQDWTVTVDVLPNTETDIISFSVAGQAGPATIDKVGHTVTVKFSYGTDVTALVPTIGLSAGASIDPASGVVVDLSVPVAYTVTAEDGVTVQVWTATVVILPNTATDILTFTLPEQTGPATINNVLHNVILEVKYGTDVSALAPTIALSHGATINPGSGVVVDFSVPIVYKVTAEDGVTSRNYIVAVMVSTISNETDIIGFTLPEQAGPATIDNLLHTVEIEVPFETDITSLAPSIGLSAGATVDPASGISSDFSDPVVYTVLAEDGETMQDWTATVVVLPNTEADIISFTLPEQAGPATIDNLSQTVEIEVPRATDVTSLVPSIELSAGATIDPAGGIATDFSVPVVYSVTSEDGVFIRDWTVTVVLQLRNETDIVEFSLFEQTAPARIDSLRHIIVAKVPDGTDITALQPDIALSEGATADPASGVPVDFSDSVVYTVVAEDGVTIQDWMVAVVYNQNTETDVISFSLAEQSGPAAIDTLLHTVEVEVPWATDVTSLVPSIGLSAGATIDPASGEAADFSSSVVYTVTAEDGATIQDWTVTVVRLPNTETDIVEFSLAEQTGQAIIDNLMHTVNIEVVKETDITALIPTIVLSEGASIDPVSGETADFSAPVVYTVTAEDGITVQKWTVSVTVDQAVSVLPATAPLSFKVYPNPAIDLVNVEHPENGNIYLLDITGHVVTAVSDVSTKTTISVSEFERGIYFIQFIRDDSNLVYKIILE